MKKILLSLLGTLVALPALALDFTYKYEGQTLTYTVSLAAPKTCMVKSCANDANGMLSIPEIAKNGNEEYIVTTIGDEAFFDCSSLTSAVIPNSVTTIGNSAFSGCSGLTSVTIPNSVTSIGSRAFMSCNGLTSVTIPNSVTSIDIFAFYGCSSLASLLLPNAITSIEEGTFYECSSLTSVVIPNSVTSIGKNAFMGCSGLTSVTIPNAVTSVGNGAFSDCSSLTSLLIPNSVTSIGKNAFMGCSGLTSVTFPYSVTSVGNSAFHNCSSLATVTFGSSVTSIGNYAFDNCALTEVILPPSVETIGIGVFRNNASLNSITMGYNVKTIGSKAFNGCPAQIVRITAQTPPAAPDDAFSSYTGNLYVQNQASAGAYRNAESCWNKFTNYVMVEPTEFKVEGDQNIYGKPGDIFQLTARLMPENVTLPQVFWSSNNTDIATVDENGLVTLHAEDMSQVRAMDEGANHVRVRACIITAESLYADGPLAEFTIYNSPAGIGEITDDSEASGEIDPNMPAQVYNLQGVMVSDSVDNLATGIYIVRQGRNVKKVAVK